MARLVFLDDVGGSLAALAAAMAQVEGAPGFSDVVARERGAVRLDPVVAVVLPEVGVNLVPVVKAYMPAEGDVIVSLGARPAEGATEHWDVALAPEGAAALVQRATARTTRDGLAVRLAAFCAKRRG
jgi:hypothetical protein